MNCTARPLDALVSEMIVAGLVIVPLSGSKLTLEVAASLENKNNTPITANNIIKIILISYCLEIFIFKKLFLFVLIICFEYLHQCEGSLLDNSRVK